MPISNGMLGSAVRALLNAAIDTVDALVPTVAAHTSSLAGLTTDVAARLSDRASRADLVAWVASNAPANGRTYAAGGLAYKGQAGAAVIPDLPGLVPADRWTPGHFGDIGTADDVVVFQRAIDALHAAGGGELHIPAGLWNIGPSQTGETFDNDGAVVPASSCGLIVRKRVRLIGAGRGRTHIRSTTNTTFILALVAPEDVLIQGLEISAWWDMGEPGAGHGIFTLSTAGGADRTTRRCTFRDLHIHHVASYGIGLQAGSPQDCVIENVIVEDVGADGLDLKARSAEGVEARGNFVANVVVRNHALRQDGAAGIDVRGAWHLSGITVADFGNNPALTAHGIRFRTKPAESGTVSLAGERSSLTGFYIRPRAGFVGTACYGVTSGSDDVNVSNGVVADCTEGVTLTGNANGSALRNTITGVTAIDCTTYGFHVGAGVEHARFIGCTSYSSAGPGFRNEGDYTLFVGCRSVDDASSFSPSTAAQETEMRIGAQSAATPNVLHFEAVAAGSGPQMLAAGPDANIDALIVAKGAGGVDLRSNGARAVRAGNPSSAVNWVQFEGSATGSGVNISSQGSDGTVDIRLSPKGSGLLRFGTLTASADAPVSGYIEIKDAGGTVRKLAIIS